MSTFSAYFQIGLEHILTLDGLDHILFIVLLCLGYSVQNWKRTVGLVTAFTLAHSLTLALSVLGWVNVPSEWVELLIPVTITLTAALNVWTAYRPGASAQNFGISYALVACFGLLHGLGFSNLLRSMLSETSTLAAALFAFNVGIEVGQLVIVLVVLQINYVLFRFRLISWRWWTGVVSGLVLLFSLSFYI